MLEQFTFAGISKRRRPLGRYLAHPLFTCFNSTMKYIFTYRIKLPFILFAVLGFILSLAIFQVLSNWIAVWAALYGKPNLGYHDLSPVIHGLQWALRCAVWAFPVIIFGLDRHKRDFTRITGYLVGLIFAMLVTSIIFWIRWVEVMAEF